MDKDPFISVVIPLYNKERNIKNTIQSVLNQTYDNYEIIVVDDGSTDNSAKIVKSLSDERIKLIHQQNGGVSKARNKGVQEAQYDYIAFLDGDDFWNIIYLEMMSKLIIDYPKATLFGMAYNTYFNSSFIPENFKNIPPDFRGIIRNYFESAKQHLLFWTSAVVIKKESFLHLGGFDERITIGEDLDMWFRIALDFPVAFHNKPLSYYNLDADNRAMKRKHDYTNSFLCYTQKYKEREQNNANFRSFINHFRCSKLIDLFINYDITPQQMREYIATISLKDIPVKWRVFVILPYFLKKQIIKKLYNKKQLYEII